jgi:hypothetical protein
MTKSMVPVSTDRTVARREANPFSFLSPKQSRPIEIKGAA